MADSNCFYKPEQAICYGDGREQRLLAFIESHPRLAEMRNCPQEVLSAIDEFGQADDFLMNVGSFKGKVVVEHIQAQKPGLMVELGGYVGYSAIMFGAALRAAGGRRYLSLEMNPEFAAVSSALVFLAGLQDFVKIIVGPCATSLQDLRQATSESKIDLLFVDHQKSAYVKDLMLCEELSLIVPGSVVIADNIISPGAPLYLEYVRGSCQQKREIRESLGPGNDGYVLQGKPELIYETTLHESLEPTGERVGGVVLNMRISVN